MLGKASEIKTKLAQSYFYQNAEGNLKAIEIDKAVNETLLHLCEPGSVPTIISIQYQMSQNTDIADSALIIYKETNDCIECPKCGDPFCVGTCKEGD